MLFEAVAARWYPSAPLPATIGLVLAWLASTAAGAGSDAAADDDEAKAALR